MPIRLSQLGLDGEALLWVEARPQDLGRQVLVRLEADGTLRDVTTAEHNVRSGVHEYGGMAWVADRGSVWFTDYSTGRLHYIAATGAPPHAITPDGDLRYADLQIDRDRRRLLCVLEDHTVAPGSPPQNCIAAVPLEGGRPHALAGGHDFAAEPRLSPDGRLLSWITWDHPAMPWTSTVLWVGELGDDGGLEGIRPIAGGQNEAVLAPRWAPDGTLWYSSDRDHGWWHLWQWSETNGSRHVTTGETEVGRPPWMVGYADHAFIAGHGLFAAVHTGPVTRLSHVDEVSGSIEELPLEYTELALGGSGCRLAMIASSPSEPAAVVEVQPQTGKVTVFRRSLDITLDRRYVARPRQMTFTSGDDRIAHAVFYPPTNPDCDVPDDELPPLRVVSHGGPTAGTTTAYRADIAYFTSRGFAVLDVDYGGSSGYGRAYRELLDGTWGIVDVEDCLAGVRHVLAERLADPARVVIRGGSAGGYTTLQSLVTTDAYAAGCSLFGVGDLILFRAQTHKFESHYLDTLIGPWPEARTRYEERSPVLHTERLNTPVVLFHGARDRVVPLAQSEAFHQAAKAKGIASSLIVFPDEQHGFRNEVNIRLCLEGEFSFYSRVLGFDSTAVTQHDGDQPPQ